MVITEVYSDLTEIFSDVFMRDDLVLRPDMTAQDVEGWDSFKMIEIVMGIEDKFKFKFSTRELDNLSNVGEMAQIIADKGNDAVYPPPATGVK